MGYVTAFSANLAVYCVLPEVLCYRFAFSAGEDDVTGNASQLCDQTATLAISAFVTQVTQLAVQIYTRMRHPDLQTGLASYSIAFSAGDDHVTRIAFHLLSRIATSAISASVTQATRLALQIYI